MAISIWVHITSPVAYKLLWVLKKNRHPKCNNLRKTKDREQIKQHEIKATEKKLTLV